MTALETAPPIAQVPATVRQWAEFYVDRGLPVLPLWWTTGTGCGCGDRGCGSPGKHPLGVAAPRGKDDATTDETVVAGWFDRYPHANIGARPPTGVIVVDVDPRNGGDVALAEMQDRHGELPFTLEAHTGGGGRHLWFAYAGRSIGRVGPGLDVKTSTGYLVAPPSLHASGRYYRWACETATAPAPRWLRALLDPPRRPTRHGTGGPGATRGLVRVVAEAPEGNRNKSLFWAACRAYQNETLDVLDDLTEAAIAAGIPDREIRRTIASAERTVAL